MQVLYNTLALIDWLNQNFWWPVILFGGSVFLIIKIILMQPRKGSNVDSSKYIGEVIDNLGGRENIITASIEGSRVKFQVNQIELANLEAFKAMGAVGVFISGKNVKMVLPFNAKELVDRINIDINGGKL